MATPPSTSEQPADDQVWLEPLSLERADVSSFYPQLIAGQVPTGTTPVVNRLQLADAYRIVLDTRKFEIENFWKRTTFFWGTISILLVGYFGVKIEERWLVFIAYIGFLYNFIFCLSLRGSKYWQEHWEQLAIRFERSMGQPLFWYHTEEVIRRHEAKALPWLRARRISVSKLTMILSDLTLPLWGLLIARNWHYLIVAKKVSLSISPHASPHWFTWGAIGFPLLILGYALAFYLYRWWLRSGHNDETHIVISAPPTQIPDDEAGDFSQPTP